MTYDQLTQAGINAAEGIHRFGNNEALFFRCLKKFPADPHFKDLQAAIHAQDYDSAFKHAHTLKGVAGNLALEDLYALTITICEDLRHQVYDTVNTQLVAIDEAYQKILLALQSLD